MALGVGGANPPVIPIETVCKNISDIMETIYLSEV